MSRYVWGLRAAVRNAMLPCPACKASAGSPCTIGMHDQCSGQWSHQRLHGPCECPEEGCHA